MSPPNTDSVNKSASPPTLTYSAPVKSTLATKATHDPDVELEPTIAHKASLMGRFRSLFKRHRSSSLEIDGSELESSGEPSTSSPRKSTHIDHTKDLTDPTPFMHKPSRLASLVDPKNLDELEAMGGIEAILRGLGVDGEEGLQVMGGETAMSSGMGDEQQYKASMEERQRVFGHNVLPSKKTKGLLELMWMALKDKVLVRQTLETFMRKCFFSPSLTKC